VAENTFSAVNRLVGRGSPNEHANHAGHAREGRLGKALESVASVSRRQTPRLASQAESPGSSDSSGIASQGRPAKTDAAVSSKYHDGQGESDLGFLRNRGGLKGIGHSHRHQTSRTSSTEPHRPGSPTQSKKRGLTLSSHVIALLATDFSPPKLMASAWSPICCSHPPGSRKVYLAASTRIPTVMIG